MQTHYALCKKVTGIQALKEHWVTHVNVPLDVVLDSLQHCCLWCLYAGHAQEDLDHPVGECPRTDLFYSNDPDFGNFQKLLRMPTRHCFGCLCITRVSFPHVLH